MIHAQKAGYSRIIERHATLLVEITEMVADFSPDMRAAQLLLPEIHKIVPLPVDNDRNRLHLRLVNNLILFEFNFVIPGHFPDEGNGPFSALADALQLAD